MTLEFTTKFTFFAVSLQFLWSLVFVKTVYVLHMFQKYCAPPPPRQNLLCLKHLHCQQNNRPLLYGAHLFSIACFCKNIFETCRLKSIPSGPLPTVFRADEEG